MAEGTLIRENAENVHRLASCLVRIATNFKSGFNEIVPLLDAGEKNERL